MLQLKVGARLAVAFGLLLALMVLGAAVALFGVRSAEQQASRLASENVALLNAVSAMRVAQLNEAVAIRDFVGLPDLAVQQAAQWALKSSDKAFNDAAASLEALAAQSEEDNGLAGEAARLRAANGQLGAKLREALELAEMAEYQQAQQLVYKEVRPLQAAIASSLEALATRSNALAAEREEAAHAQARRVLVLLLATVALGLALGILATVLITRGIVRPLNQAVRIAERVADGDLTRVDVAMRADETGRVLAALAAMSERLHGLLGAIRRSADEVRNVSARVSDANADLAARTEEQAASLEETAASVEELTATVKLTTENAGQASTLTGDAARMADEGGRAVLGVVQTMEGIQRSARRVSDIVGLMDEIAFQTNLLALNAAVEAARAGEHGRGFGVVAQQIRALARRSAEASRDIKQLATDSVGEADKGSKAATRAGDTMREVVRAAGEAARYVSDIARASEEQRAGIEQVNRTIAQMEGVTQSNARLVQEITALADGLLREAAALVDATAQFRLDAQDAQETRDARGDQPPLATYEEDEPASIAHSGWQTLPAPLS